MRVTHMVDRINDITVSNRILAVNARIQAAQLGEQGRGFGAWWPMRSRCRQNTRRKLRRISRP